MYRFGDGTAFPLEENFIDTLTQAVEACTQAFSLLAELDARRDKAQAAERDSQREVERLMDLDRVVAEALGPFMPGGGGSAGLAQATAMKIIAATKQSVSAVRSQVESRARALLAEAAPSTIADRVQASLAPFFERVELPGAKWVLSWEARSGPARAEATATSGKLAATFSLDVAGAWQAPIRNEQFASDVIVHLVRKRTFGKAKATPIDLGKMLMVGIEHTSREVVLWVRETPKSLAGFRFTIAEDGVTFCNVGAGGEVESEVLAVADEDLPNLRRLTEAAVTQLAALRARRTVRELRFGAEPLVQLAEPKAFPLELLSQLTPLCRMLRDRSPVAGELVLKRDIGDGRREELFVPRAALAARFAPLPASYRRPFEDMGLGNDGDAAAAAKAIASLPSASAPTQKIMG
ncbi:MAG: hypothetical protein IPI49_26660 [Myxococcales bacterium]|nr:hypothetical protein [Myxococcales bacterium]